MTWVERGTPPPAREVLASMGERRGTPEETIMETQVEELVERIAITRRAMWERAREMTFPEAA